MEIDTGEEPATRVAQDSGGAGSSMDHVRARVPVAMEAPGSRDDGLSQGVVAGEEREDHGREEEGEEGESPKGVRAPLRVRKEEREAHELTHTPYRAWCRHCVRARGRNAPHRTRDEERKAGGIPKVAMDYFFMSAADEHAHENPIIVMIDESTGEKYARAVGQKGLGREAGDVDWLIKDMSQELKAWGHAGGEAGHIILKCDGERSIKAVRDALAKYHGGKVVPEDPPRGESQSNGVVEEAGKTTREFVRVLKEQVEHSANIKLECAEVLTEWMVRWAAMLCSRYLRGKDGLTAYERRRGRPCHVPVVGFGEKVWYKELRVGKERRDKFESEWREGIWLGHSRESNEAIVGTKVGAVRAYAVKRQDEEHRWDSELIKNLQGTPQQPDPSKAGIAIPVRVNFDPPMEAAPVPLDGEERGKQMRRMKITATMLRKYGYSDQCEGCRYRRAGLQESRNHTEACRQRIETELEKDDEGRRKKAEDDERINRRLAEEMERALGPDSAGTGGAAEGPSRNVAADDGASGSVSGNPMDEPPAPASAPASEERDSERAGPQQGASQAVRAEMEGEGCPGGGGGGGGGGAGAQGESRPRPRERSRSPRSRPGGGVDARQDSDSQPKRGAASEEENHAVKRRKEEGPEDMDLDIVQEILRVSVDIAEMYSPPRVTAEAKNFGLKTGEAMDLTTGWDFSQDEHKERALKYIDEYKPKLIIGSPMCTMFSQLQRLSGWNDEKQRRWREDTRHLKFMAQVYRIQATQGRWFLHEHSASASSWSLKEIADLLEMDGVGVVQADQCMYGLKTWGRNGKEVSHARKRTQFMSNSQEIRAELSRKCDGGHRHQSLTGGRAEASARYPKELCRAICVGLMREIKHSSKRLMKLIDVEPHTRVHGCSAHEEEEEWRQAWDDITGEELDSKEVTKARLKEMQYIDEKKVWKVIPRSEALKHGWKIIDTRWIDINKGDKQRPNYRSRLVAKEFNDGTQPDGLFAATPPLEALRLLLSEAATVRDGADSPEKVVMINDVARAFFEAPVRRTVCVKLPLEATGQEGGGEDMVGLLQMSLYGTRDAAANFQEEVRKVMLGAGFTQSAYSPSVYWHRGRGLKTLVHGDDFITTGARGQAAWFRKVLEGRFEIKTKVVGPGPGEAKEERVLNRIIRVTAEGWEYEADQRHADLIISGMNLEDAKGVRGPGEDEKPWEEEENNSPVTHKETKEFRALAARANYLAQDRSDIQYAAKEICRGMASPTRGHVKKLRRLARYLIDAPRVVWFFKYQGNCEQLDVYSDSDWAGCRRTARSTTGGAIMRGSHCIRSWSSTQKFVTLSSAEAELMAAVRATTEAIGIAQLAASWGVGTIVGVFVDSSAALAIVSRKGNGKLRHVKVGHLWIQEKAASGEVVYSKVSGERNPADLMTKYVPPHRVVQLSEQLSQIRTQGHAKARLAIGSFGPADGLVSEADYSRSGTGESDPSDRKGRGGVFIYDRRMHDA